MEKPSTGITRILGIAPYEGMKIIMQKLAEERNNIQLDVFIGNLNEGVEIVRRNSRGNYDIIVSRGGTAELIRQNTAIPVIEVTLSVYDILRAIKLAENYSGRFAIVGFPGITENAHLLCDLLQYQLDIFTIHDQAEVLETLQKLKDEGYHMVLCDMVTNTTANHLGLNSILITSGPESIDNAFDQAVNLNLNYSAIKKENQLLKDIISGGTGQTIVLRENGEPFLSTADDVQYSALRPLLLRKLKPILENGSQKFFKNLDDALYSFCCRRIPYRDGFCAAYYYSANPIPMKASKYGIQYSNQLNNEDVFFSSVYNTVNPNSFQTIINNLNQTNSTVMLFGESGSGKKHMARLIYSQSQLCYNPLITISCPLMNERNWLFITNHYNSPFNDNNNTIFLEGIDALSEKQCIQLLSIIIDTNLCKRNRIIFSCTVTPGTDVPPRIMNIVNSLSCVTIKLPPLREHSGEIPSLSSLYLNVINISMANQIIGFEPEAIHLLQEYDWPFNYIQFERVLNELALVTTTPYISARHVKIQLKKERELARLPQPAHLSQSPAPGVDRPKDAPKTCSIRTDQSLDDITRQIIRHVLTETNGNQSQAAKQLGISRTTLWRYLKNEGERP